MKRAKLIWLLVLLAAPGALMAAATTNPYESPQSPAPTTQIDKIVFAKLKQLGITPANRCSDAVFLRRVYLDVIGTLPTADEARRFLQDDSVDKRQAMIDRLLDREQFADYWAMRWSDVLRIKAEFPVDLWPNAAQGYYHWIHSSIKQNKPYDQFAREMLIASGSNFRVPQVNFYRAVQNREAPGLAGAVALTFMGMRVERWPADRLNNMAVFFRQVGHKSTTEWKEEIIFNDPGKVKDPPATATFPDGTTATLPPTADPREVFANWLVDSNNPYFARCAANRIWTWLLGRGIVQEPDDFRPDNPPSNPELLHYLAGELVRNKYDLKQVYRLILNSQTYQLSSLARSSDAQAAANLAAYPLRRLDAEVLSDAICQLTETSESYTSAVPEPYTVMPVGQRAIALPDGSITSSFLEMFGRPSRDTGLDSERNNRPTASQYLELLNSSHIQRKLETGALTGSAGRMASNPKRLAEEAYLTILSRFPTEQESKTVEDYLRSHPSKREAVVDIAWALINSDEFLYRH